MDINLLLTQARDRLYGDADPLKELLSVMVQRLHDIEHGDLPTTIKDKFADMAQAHMSLISQHSQLGQAHNNLTTAVIELVNGHNLLAEYVHNIAESHNAVAVLNNVPQVIPPSVAAAQAANQEVQTIVVGPPAANVAPPGFEHDINPLPASEVAPPDAAIVSESAPDKDAAEAVAETPQPGAQPSTEPAGDAGATGSSSSPEPAAIPLEDRPIQP